MATIERSFDVSADPTVVMDYLKDFSNAAEWDPGTESCTRNDVGEPIAVGSSWHNVSRLAGVSTELTYVITDLTADKVVFAGSNDSAHTTDTITVQPSDSIAGGTLLTYHAEIEMTGAAQLADPLVKVFFEKVGAEVEKNLLSVLSAR